MEVEAPPGTEPLPASQWSRILLPATRRLELLAFDLRFAGLRHRGRDLVQAQERWHVSSLPRGRRARRVVLRRRCPDRRAWSRVTCHCGRYRCACSSRPRVPRGPVPSFAGRFHSYFACARRIVNPEEYAFSTRREDLSCSTQLASRTPSHLANRCKWVAYRWIRRCQLTACPALLSSARPQESTSGRSGRLGGRGGGSTSTCSRRRSLGAGEADVFPSAASSGRNRDSLASSPSDMFAQRSRARRIRLFSFVVFPKDRTHAGANSSRAFGTFACGIGVPPPSFSALLVARTRRCHAQCKEEVLVTPTCSGQEPGLPQLITKDNHALHKDRQSKKNKSLIQTSTRTGGPSAIQAAPDSES